MNRQTASRAAGSDLDRILSGESIVGLGDGALLDRVARGIHPEAGVALDALIRRHGALVARVCGGIVGDAHAAEDATQAVFLVLSRRAGSIRDPDRLASWLYGVALRTARAARTRLARHRRHLDPGPLTPDDPSMIDPRPDPAQTLMQREQAEILHRAIARLPRRYLDPIVLCDLSGLTHAEAAAQLDCPPVTVSVRLKRAREQLRSRLSRHRLDFETALPPILAGSAIPRIATATSAAHLLAHRVAWSLALAKWQVVALVVLVAGGTALGVHASDRSQPAPASVPPGVTAAQDPTPPPRPVESPQAGAAQQATGEPKPRKILMDPLPTSPQVTPGKVVVGYPTVRDVVDLHQYAGTLAASRSVEIRAHLNGVLSGAAVPDGEMVEQGALLFRIHDASTEDGLREKSLELTAARQRMIQAEEARGRVVDDPQATAVEKGHAAERFEAVASRCKEVIARVNEEIEEATTIRAPFAGQVERRPVEVGATVEVGKTPLATIRTTDPIWANFEMDETTFLKIQRQFRANPGTPDLPVRFALSDEKGFALAGQLKLKAARPSPGTGTFAVHAEISNPDGALFPGLSAQVLFEFGEPRPALLVPTSAILDRSSKPRILLVDGNQVAHFEWVRLGSIFDGLCEIKSKLGPASRIVLEGGQYIPDGTTLTEILPTGDSKR